MKYNTYKMASLQDNLRLTLVINITIDKDSKDNKAKTCQAKKKLHVDQIKTTCGNTNVTI